MVRFFSIRSSYALALHLNGRKFGNSVSQFSDATLEIGHGGVTPLFAGLCASIEPHTFFGKILKNLELAPAKDNLGRHRIRMAVRVRPQVSQWALCAS
jgi:hypothetical protein